MTTLKYWIHDAYRQSVAKSLRELGWTETEADDWQLRWDLRAQSVSVYQQSSGGRLFNHFHGIHAVTDKSELHKNLAETRDRLAKQGITGVYDFFPRTYSMPEDWEALLEAAVTTPDAIWIKKPKGLSRGRDIELLNDISEVELDPNWLVQEYLSSPHLIDGYKYSIRLYVLITSLDPLLVYLYPDGTVRPTTRRFTADRAHLKDKFIHLTNIHILQHDPTVEVYERSTHGAYRELLRETGIDADRLWVEVKRLLVATMIAARESILASLEVNSLEADGCFELLGIDVVVDSNIKPWLIECNLSPSLDVDAAPDTASSEAEGVIKRSLIQDTLRLILATNKPSDVGSTSGQTVRARDRSVETVRRRAALELAHCGKFQRIFPAEDVAEYANYFPVPRRFDIQLAKDLCAEFVPLTTKFEALEVHHYFLDDRLVLFSEEERSLLLLNPVASFIWLRCVEGLPADEISRQLVALFPDAGPIEYDVRSILAQWVQTGFLGPREDSTGAPVAERATAELSYMQSGSSGQIGWNDGRTYKYMGWRFCLRFPSVTVESWIHPTLAHMESPRESEVDADIEVVSGASGYVLCKADGSAVPCHDAHLLTALIHEHVRDCAFRANDCIAAFSAPVIGNRDGDVLILGETNGGKGDIVMELVDAGFTLQSNEAVLVHGDETPIFQSLCEPNSSGLSLRAVLYTSTMAGDAAKLMPLSAAESLGELLTDDHGVSLAMDPRSVSGLVQWISDVDCYRLLVGSASEVIDLISQICSKVPPTPRPDVPD